MMMLVWSRRAVGEIMHTQRSCWKSEEPAGTDFSQNYRPYILLKLPYNSLDQASSSTQCLFSLAMGYYLNHRSRLSLTRHMVQWIRHLVGRCFSMKTLGGCRFNHNNR